MTVRDCRRCHQRWATNAPEGITTRFCPGCIPLISHRLTSDSATRSEIAAGVS